MRLIAFAAVSALALSAGACAPRVDYAHKTTLDCPDRQGELRRTSVAPDQKSCTYRADEGAEITLQLASVNGDAGAVLSAIETQLTGPAAPGQTPKADADAKAGKAAPASVSSTGSADAAKAAQEAANDASAGGGKGDWDDKDSVRDARNDRGRGHDNAHVSLPGLHIDADDDNAKVDVAGIHIDANDSEQTVHVMRDVRLRGQGFSHERNGVRATFIAKRDNLPDGYRWVGYQAGGPKTGPLTIAVVKSRDEISDGGRLYRDIQRLVRRNSGA